MVLGEAGDGDAVAARKRLQAIRNFPILDLTVECHTLAQRLVHLKAVPQECPEDALHVAVATIIPSQKQKLAVPGFRSIRKIHWQTGSCSKW